MHDGKTEPPIPRLDEVDAVHDGVPHFAMGVAEDDEVGLGGARGEGRSVVLGPDARRVIRRRRGEP